MHILLKKERKGMMTMKISVYNGYSGRRDQKRQRLRLALLLCFMIIGMIVGAVLVCTFDDVNPLIRLRFSQNIFKKSRGISFFEQFRRSFLPLAGLLGIEFFSGFFAFGQAVGSAAVFFRGIASGISAAVVYLSMGWGGLPTMLLSVIHLSLCGAFILLIGAGEAWKSANRIAVYCFMPSEVTAPSDIKLYSIKFAAMTALSSVICVIDTAAVHWFL